MHSWDLSYREAVALQRELAARLQQEPIDLDSIETVCGVDVSSSRRSTLVHSAAVVLQLDGFREIERSAASVEAPMPYIPGLLSFREGPAVLEALERLRIRPDVVVFDGQGYAHPRRLGLAAHLGLWLGLPTVGCAKTRLVGEYAPPPDLKGAWSPLVDVDETIGAVLRTREGVKPVFVSRGHLCDLPSAIAVVMATVGRYRLPEPARAAHALCNEARLSAEEE